MTNRTKPALRPLDPILDPETRYGSIAPGNTPPAAPTGCRIGDLYDTILAQMPLSFWPLCESTGITFLDDAAGNDGTWETGFDLAAVAGPDGADYVFLNGSGASPGGEVPGDPSPPDYSIATNSGITICSLVHYDGVSLPSGSIIAKGEVANTTFDEWLIFINSGLIIADVLDDGSLARRRVGTDSIVTGWNLVIVQMPSTTTAPNIRLNGVLGNGASPGSGTGLTASGPIQMGRRSTSTELSPAGLALVAIFAGVDAGIPTAIEAAALAEGWYS